MPDSASKEVSFKPMIIFMFISLAIAAFWDTFPLIKNTVHSALDPILTPLLSWNLTVGMLVIVALIAIATTLAQKYATDQETLKELKRQQKEINIKSKEFKNDPQKMMEIQKEIWPISMKIMKHSSRSIIFTGVPFILLFRWFMDYFTAMNNPHILGFFSWFWFYLIFVMVFSSILRKVLKVE